MIEEMTSVDAVVMSMPRTLTVAGEREPVATVMSRQLRGLFGSSMSAFGLVLAALLAFVVAAWLRGDYVAKNVAPMLVTFAVIAGLLVMLLAATLEPAARARRTQPAPLLRED